MRYTVLPLSYSIPRTHSPVVPRHVSFKNQRSPLQEECVQIRLAFWFIIFMLVHISALDKLVLCKYLAFSLVGSGKTRSLIVEAREKLGCQEVKLLMPKEP